MKPWIVWIVLWAASSALAEGTELSRQLDHLHEGQAEVEGVLKQLRGSLGFPDSDQGTARGPEKESHGLFQTHSALSTVRLASGRLLFGRLVNRLVIGTEGSPALVELDPDQGLGSRVRVLGTARQAGTEGRVSIELTRLLFPAKEVTLQAQALDADGALGLPAQVWSSKAWSVVGAMASSFVSGLAASQQTQVSSPLGFSQVEPTGRNGLLQGVAQTAADQSKRMIDEATAEKPVLVVDAGAAVTVLIREDAKW